jgi:hypothetical protein
MCDEVHRIGDMDLDETPKRFMKIAVLGGDRSQVSPACTLTSEGI